jgi:hypothetical protein
MDRHRHTSAPETRGGWTVVYRSRDGWAASLVQTALVHAKIPNRTGQETGGRGVVFRTVAVPEESESAALDVVLRVVDALAAPERRGTEAGDELPEPPRAIPTDVPVRVIAERESIGAIAHIEGYGFELRVGPAPYWVVPEEQWEEFTDFSAQRQEFAILLEKEYSRLYRWLRAEKKFGEFLRLVESTYRGAADEDTPAQFLRAAGWMVLAVAGIVALIAAFRWIESLTFGVAG